MFYQSRTLLRDLARGFISNQGMGLMIALILYIYGKVGPFRLTLIISLVFSNLSWLCINIFGFLFRVNWTIHRPWTTAFLAKASGAFFLGLVVATEIGNLIVSVGLHRPFIPFFSLWHLFLILMNLGVSVVVVLLVGLYKSLTYRLDRRDREYAELENLQIRTRLAALQAKINPHFLFNTLNVILDLAHHAPEKIESVVLNLSDIYRRVLGDPRLENAESTLGDEVELIRKYLEIEKIRLEKRLDFDIEWDSGLASLRLPPLLIEPLIENAVIHGIAPKREGGRIILRLLARSGKLEISIIDDGVGLGLIDGGVKTTLVDDAAVPAAAGKEAGFGLYSVRERLRLLYGEKASLSITPVAAGGAQVRMELPLAP